MAIITTSNFAKALWPGVNAWYGKSYAEYPTEWTSLVDTNSSRKRYEEDIGVTSFGLASSKEEGSGVAYDTERQAYLTRYTHVVYALGFMVSREAFDDDLYDVVGQRRAQGLAFSMHQTKETVVANVYNRAATSGYNGGDGVTLLSTSHPNIAGGTWANKPSVDADLSEAALEQACIDIAKFTNDRGLRIKVLPNKLIIPVDLDFEASRILKTEYRVGTANNDINVLNMEKRFPGGVVVNHYLTDTDAWFIRTNVPHGLKLFQRNGMEFAIDNDFDTENAKFKARERYSVGWTDPRALYGSTGA